MRSTWQKVIPREPGRWLNVAVVGALVAGAVAYDRSGGPSTETGAGEEAAHASAAPASAMPAPDPDALSYVPDVDPRDGSAAGAEPSAGVEPSAGAVPPAGVEPAAGTSPAGTSPTTTPSPQPGDGTGAGVEPAAEVSPATTSPPDTADTDAGGEQGVTGAREGGFEATPEDVQQAVESTARDSYRYSVALDVAGLGGASGDPAYASLVTGEADGEQVSMHVDLLAGITGSVGLAEFLQLLPPDLARSASVDIVVDGDTVYVTTPLFETLLGVVPEWLPTLPSLRDLRDLDSGWGRIDLEGVGLLTDLAGTFNGSRTFNPDVFLDLLRRADLVDDLGQGAVEGVPVRGVGADVNVGDVMRSQGVPPSVLGQAAFLEEATFRIEAWADDDHRIRQIQLYVGADTFMQQLDRPGMADDELFGLGLMAGIVVNFTDYGDTSIDVEVPENAEELLSLPGLPASST